MCYQTQRYAMYRGDNLVFETTQVRTPPFCFASRAAYAWYTEEWSQPVVR